MACILLSVTGSKNRRKRSLVAVDGNGNTIGFNYNNIPYFYMKNLQGDIIGITDASGNIVAKYTYDSWGKLISIKDASDVDKTTDTTFIGYINPLRYRGYYYDSETGLYYLNARYYDPEIGRFMSSDETLDGGYNLFEYCYNNPIRAMDYSGHVPVEMLRAISVAPAYQAALDGSFGQVYGQNWEYGFVIYQNLATREYVCGNANTIRNSVWWAPNEEEMAQAIAAGYAVAGFWHCHQFNTDVNGVPNNGYYGFSQADIIASNNRHAPVFCHTAGGELISYEPQSGVFTHYVGMALRRDPNLDLYLAASGMTEQQLKMALEPTMAAPPR